MLLIFHPLFSESEGSCKHFLPCCPFFSDFRMVVATTVFEVKVFRLRKRRECLDSEVELSTCVFPRRHYQKRQDSLEDDEQQRTVFVSQTLDSVHHLPPVLLLVDLVCL